jgi:hypothetical protein
MDSVHRIKILIREKSGPRRLADRGNPLQAAGLRDLTAERTWDAT